MEKEEQIFLIKYVPMKNWGSKKIHQQLVTRLGADVYSRSEIKTWIQKFRNGDLSCKDAPRTGRPLDIGATTCGIFQKSSLASARVLVQHFLTSLPTIKEILQRELGLKKILAASSSPFSVPDPKTCSC
jgi:hypothetical protein